MEFTKSFKIGEIDGKAVYLAPPSWDCGWYWGFGYLQSRDIHMHVNGLMQTHHTNLHDALVLEFASSLTITDDHDLWQFCELMQSFYSLKEAAEVFERGGTHYTTNPAREVIKDEAKAADINQRVLPAVFDEIEKLISKYR